MQVVTYSQALAAAAAHKTRVEAAAALGIGVRRLRKILAAGGGGSLTPSRPAPITGARSVDDFRKLHDKSFIVPERIRAALSRLGDSWMYEIDFARHAGVSITDLNHVREQFLDHIVVIAPAGRNVWAGTATLADTLRGML